MNNNNNNNNNNEDNKVDTYMKRALQNPESRPWSILRSMGVASVDSDSTLLWQPLSGGVVLHIQKHPATRHWRETVQQDAIATNNTFTNNNNAAAAANYHQNATTTTTSPEMDAASTADKRVVAMSLATTSETLAKSPLSASPQRQQEQQKVTMEPLYIRSKRCSLFGPEGNARAFLAGPEPWSVVLCTNRLRGAQEVEEALTHELIHVYDVHVQGLDLQKCENLAYSEVRASREAECFSSASAVKKNACVEQKAKLATSNLFPDWGPSCVRAVFHHAMADTKPFVGSGDNAAEQQRYTSAFANSSSSSSVDRK